MADLFKTANPRRCYCPLHEEDTQPDLSNDISGPADLYPVRCLFTFIGWRTWRKRAKRDRGECEYR